MLGRFSRCVGASILITSILQVAFFKLCKVCVLRFLYNRSLKEYYPEGEKIGVTGI